MSAKNIMIEDVVFFSHFDDQLRVVWERALKKIGSFLTDSDSLELSVSSEGSLAIKSTYKYSTFGGIACESGLWKKTEDLQEGRDKIK